MISKSEQNLYFLMNLMIRDIRKLDKVFENPAGSFFDG